MITTLKIGILTLKNNKKNYFAEQDLFRDMIIYAANKHVEIYCLTPDSLINKKEFTGYLIQDNKWIEVKVPYPDIIIDRARYNPSTPYTLYQAKLKELPVKWTNHVIGNKWQIYNLLANSSVSSYLPPTQIYTNIATFKNFLTLYQTIYFKPIFGTGGKNILKIVEEKDSWIVKGVTEKRQKVEKQFWQISELSQFLDSWANSEPFIMQKGLDLTDKKGQITDYRILIQKVNNQWLATAYGARISQVNSIVSNLHAGGKIEGLYTNLQKKFGEKNKNIAKEIFQVSIKIGRILEEKYGRLIELGLDFGVDASRKIWLIEVNSKPGHKLFTKIDNEMYKRTVKNLVNEALK